MFSRLHFWALSTLALAALVLMVSSLLLARQNAALQAQLGSRAQYVQQSQQLQTLYLEIIRGLAELGARGNDEALRTMLQKHGISYTMNAPAGTPATGTGSAGVDKPSQK